MKVTSPPKYYRFSKVLAKRTVNEQREYLLRWKGYGSGAESWVREEDCNSAVKKTLPAQLLKVSIFYEESWLHLLHIVNLTCFSSFISAKQKVIDYLVCKIGQKLSKRTTQNGHVP